MQRATHSQFDTRRHALSALSRIAILLLLAALMLVAARPTLAQTPTIASGDAAVDSPAPEANVEATLPAETTPTPTSGGETSGNEDLEGVLDGTQTMVLSLMIIILAFLSVLLVLQYIETIQKKFYDTVVTLAKIGASVKTRSEVTFPGANIPGAQDDGTIPSSPVKVAVEGPSVVITGKQSDEFSATVDGNPATGVTWTIEPPEMAGVVTLSDDKIKVIAIKTGKFTVKATVVVAGESKPVSHEVEAVAPAANEVEVPFVGRAWGTVLLGILVLAGVLVLTLANEMSSEAAGILITALLGYIFGTAVATQSGNNSQRRP